MTLFPHHQYNPKILEEKADGVPGPYWRRAHRDWRFVAAVILMLVAITTYVMTMNLAWRPRSGELPLYVPAGK